jgi:DNA-binding response OmpR family regulator
MKILVCDDDPALVSMILFKLSQDDFSDVVVARDGYQAIKHLREQEFDLVITDIHMPYHTGDEVLTLIREEQRKSTPIIMLSSDGDEDIISLAKKQGVNEFLKKPLKDKELSKAMKRLLHK